MAISRDVQKLIQSIEPERVLITFVLSRDYRKLLRETKACADQNNHDLALLLQSMDINANKIGQDLRELNNNMSQI
jgi:hypothetical protein